MLKHSNNDTQAQATTQTFLTNYSFEADRFTLIGMNALVSFYTDSDGSEIQSLKTQISNLLKRLKNMNTKHAVFENNDALYGVILFKKLLQNHTKKSQSGISVFDAPFNAWAPEHIFATCVMLGSKNLQDTPFNNEAWGLVMGLSTINLNSLEALILSAFAFNTNIEEETFLAEQMSSMRLK